MSESKEAPKSSQSIQQEYNQLAFRAGNLQYAISENGKDLALLNQQMRDLSLEFIAASAREQKEHAEASQKAAEEAKNPKPAAEPAPEASAKPKRAGKKLEAV